MPSVNYITFGVYSSPKCERDSFCRDVLLSAKVFSSSENLLDKAANSISELLRRAQSSRRRENNGRPCLS